jgi:hypothetical protein
MICTFWVEFRYCGEAEDVRMFLPGMRCPAHTPAAVNGRPENPINPAMTLDGLRRAAGLEFNYRPTDSALVDNRAVASGRRRSNDRTYRLARKETEKR